jgi:transposase
LARGLDRVLEDATLPIPDSLRALIAELWAEREMLCQRLEKLDAELDRIARQDALSKRLMSVPGVGPIIATALLAKQIEPARFANARQFAAYFGIVPDQRSSGKQVRTAGMSKRGDSHIRSLMINGAHSALMRAKAGSADPHHARICRWLERLGKRGAAVRLANRNLRILYALMKDGGTYREHAPMP